MFRIRKRKVWSFLLWLTTFNRLYIDIPLDSTIMDSYPDDGLLPDIEHRIFEDHETDPLRIFAEETAGFAEHLAELLNEDSPHFESSHSSTFLVEKMGVSDPEGVKISGQASTASVLNNFALKKPMVPDLIVHRSSRAVAEYSNPDLFPGMYCSLSDWVDLIFVTEVQNCLLKCRQMLCLMCPTNLFVIINLLFWSL